MSTAVPPDHPLAPASPPVTRIQLCNAVAKEAKAYVRRYADVDAFIIWLSGWVRRARENGHVIMFLTAEELDSPLYLMFAAIFPVGATAYAPGSAADLAEKYMLDRKGGEYGIRHDRVADKPLTEGNVMIEVEVVPSDALVF